MSACIVIPVFNHGATLAGVLAQLQPFGLPVILVDDGSDADTARTLRQLANGHPERITLYTRTENGGNCLLYTSPSPRDLLKSRMPSSA